MKRLILLLAIVAVAAVATAAGDEAAVRATLLRAFPNSSTLGISKTPIPGVFEAAIDGRIVYVTGDGRYLLGGPIFDVNADQNLTDIRLEQINMIPFRSLPFEWAFKRVKGTGARKIAIFEGPDCTYCRALEHTLKGVDNLTVYVFLFPIEQIHPGAAAKSVAVWCAKDQLKAWDETTQIGTTPPGAATCDNPLNKIAEFAKKHRITGTPTTILEDGRRLVGAVPLTELEAQLQRASKR